MGFAQAARSYRPIEGAVATVGVSDRVTFLRKTYAHLGVALIAFAAATAFMMSYMSELSLRFAFWGGQGMHFLLILALFIGVSIVRAAACHVGDVARPPVPRSRPRRHPVVVAGPADHLGRRPALRQPCRDPAARRGQPRGEPKALAVIGEAAVITLAIFIGLTVTVFVTRKDFSFLRGVLSIGIFAAFGVIIASVLFGFTLGSLFSGAMVLLMAGYILYETTLVMKHFRPTQHVAAALMLFTTVVTLFITCSTW